MKGKTEDDYREEIGEYDFDDLVDGYIGYALECAELTARVAELEGALKPFAEIGIICYSNSGLDYPMNMVSGGCCLAIDPLQSIRKKIEHLCVSDFRCAAKANALQPKQPDAGEEGK